MSVDAARAQVLARLRAALDRMAAEGKIEPLTPCPRSEIADAERTLGRPLDPAYVELVTSMGAFGRDPDRPFHGWSRSLRQLCSPARAMEVTAELRKTWGTSGRHATLVNETFFFMRWECTFEWAGIDRAGKVRVLREHRPGTMLKVAAPSVEMFLLDKCGEALETSSLDEAASEPNAVTHLRLIAPQDLSAIAALPNLERLELHNPGKDAFSCELGALPSLRVVDIRYGDLEALPDALFRAPRLERVELFRSSLSKRYTPALTSILGWFKAEAVPIAERPLYVRLFIDDEASLVHATDDALLAALDAPNPRIAENALRLLEQRLGTPVADSLDGARIAVLGKPRASKERLGAQVEAGGGSLVDATAHDATHALLCVSPKGAWAQARARGLPFVFESRVLVALDAKGARSLVKEAKVQRETTPHLRELLLSFDEANVTLAVRMMQEGGVPSGLVEALLLVTQHPKLSSPLRKNVARLAGETVPTFPKVTREVLGRTSLFGSGATKLADRLAKLDEASGGAISGKRLCLDLLATERRSEGFGDRALLYAFETGDEAFALEALALARKADSVSFAGLEGRMGPALDRAPNALARVPGLSSLSLCGTDLRRVPDAVLRVTALRSLDLSANDLKSLPESMSALTALETLDLSHNRFTSVPDVALRLHSLRRLEVRQGTAKARLTEFRVVEALRARGVVVET